MGNSSLRFMIRKALKRMLIGLHLNLELDLKVRLLNLRNILSNSFKIMIIQILYDLIYIKIIIDLIF